MSYNNFVVCFSVYYANKLSFPYSPVAKMVHLVLVYNFFFKLFLNQFLMLIPNPKAARRNTLSVFLKIDKFKMAAW